MTISLKETVRPLNDGITLKRAAGRPKDLEALAELIALRHEHTNMEHETE